MGNGEFLSRRARFGALLACEFARRRAAISARGATAAVISFAVVAGALIAAAGYLTYRFASVYLFLRVAGEAAVEARLSDLLAAAFLAATVFSVVFSAPCFEKSVFGDGGEAALAALPVSLREIVFVKAVAELPRLFAVFCVCAATLAVPCAVAAGKTAAFALRALLCALTLLPAAALLAALASPVAATVKSFFRARPLLALVAATAAVAGVFVLYSSVVSGMTEAVASSSPRAFFNAERAAAVSRTLSALYPASFAAEAAVGVKASAAYCGVIAAVSAALLVPTIRLLLPAVLRRRRNAAHTGVPRRRRGAPCLSSYLSRRDSRRVAKSPRCLFAVLVDRELRAVLGKGLAFRLFAPMILAPLAAGLLSALAAGTAANLVPLDASYPLAATVGTAVAVLLGGASASAVSSDKDLFVQLGTLPVHPKCAFAAKALLYGGAAATAGVLSGAVAAIAAGLDGAYAAAVAVTGGAGVLSATLFALRFDLSHPEFRGDAVNENGRAAAVYLVVGVALCVFVAATACALGVLSYSADGAYHGFLSRLLPPICTLIVLFISVLSTFAGVTEAVRRATVIALSPYVCRVKQRSKAFNNTRKVLSNCEGDGK